MLLISVQTVGILYNYIARLVTQLHVHMYAYICNDHSYNDMSLKNNHSLAVTTMEAETVSPLAMQEETRETVEKQVQEPESDDRNDENRMAELNSKSVPATPTTVMCPSDDITPEGPDHVLATPTAVSTAE